MSSSLSKSHVLLKSLLNLQPRSYRLLNTSTTVLGKHEASMHVKLRRRTRAKVLRESYNEANQASDPAKISATHQPSRDKKTQNLLDSLPGSSEILYGIHPIQAALHADRRVIDSSSTLYIKIPLYKRLFDEKIPDEQDQFPDYNERITDIIHRVKERKVQVLPVKNSKLDKLSQYAVHQGLCLNTKPLMLDTLRSADELDRRDGESQIMVFIDSVKDPMNLGGILRTSSYFGVDSVVLSSQCCPITSVVSKTSSGAAEFMKLYKTYSDTRIIQELVTMDWKVISSTCETENSRTLQTSFSDLQRTDRIMIIVGSEGSGINKQLTDISTHRVRINSGKMTPITLDSLNVSVASGVILYEIINKINS